MQDSNRRSLSYGQGSSVDFGEVLTLHSVPKFKESYKRGSKIKTITNFMLYSMMNHYKEKNLKSMYRFWKKSGF